MAVESRGQDIKSVRGLVVSVTCRHV